MLGVRHHGPGSARAVGEALAELGPDAVLIEGAPELDAVAALAGGPDMVPPVAGLVYAVDQPRRSAFYPLADFSPEWVALRWALAAGRPVRFADLPAANALALDEKRDAPGRRGPDRHPGRRRRLRRPRAVVGGRHRAPLPRRRDLRRRDRGDGGAARARPGVPPLRTCATDERRSPGRGDVAARRAQRAPRSGHAQGDPGALAGGAGRVAVVCGAWHAPALLPEAFPSVTADNALLRGLPKLKVAATWVPWTSALLARRSGYGAGVDSPGWYRHLFTAPDDVPTRWLVKAARLLRDGGHDVSPAATVEAVRLADGLAGAAGPTRTGPGRGDGRRRGRVGRRLARPLAAHRPELLVGDDLGSVPDDTPMVPLARDLASAQRRLRLPASAAPKTVELDLRNATAPATVPAPAPSGHPRGGLGGPGRDRPDRRHVQGGVGPAVASRLRGGADRGVGGGDHDRVGGGRHPHRRRRGRLRSGRRRRCSSRRRCWPNCRRRSSPSPPHWRSARPSSTTPSGSWPRWSRWPGPAATATSAGSTPRRSRRSSPSCSPGWRSGCRRRRRPSTTTARPACAA